MEERLTKKGTQNWLKCMFATYSTRDVIAELADLGFKAFYSHVRSDMRAKHGILETNTCCSCSDPSKLCQLCSEICIRLWENHRFKKSKLKGPSWSNTDSTKWCTESWELAKCYMPPTGYRDKPNANSTDFNGIIGAIYNCTWMQCYFTDDLSKDSNICIKAREEVNKLRHIQDTNIVDGDMISFFDCLLNLLNDPAHLNSFKPAIDARIYLKQIQQDTLPLSEKAVKRMLNKVYEDRKEEFRGRLIQFYTTTKETVSVSPLREGHDKSIWDVFVQPKLSQVTMEKDGTRKKTENAVYSYKAVFYKDEKLNSRVFVQGEPGMGKTTFLTKLTLDWCDAVSGHNPDHKATFSDVEVLKEFRFLFQISLRDATDQREVIEMIKTQIIDMMYTGDKREETFKLVLQILERETCIITLDGLNEWVDRLNKCIIPLLAQCLTKCVSVITTRPWKMVDERIKDSEIKTLFEIEGIIDVEKLAKKVIHSLQTGNVKTHPAFMTYVKELRLWHFITSPWRLTMLVNLWMNYKASGSLCEINCILIDTLFKNANARKGYFQKETSFQCLSNTRFIQHQIDILNALANAAFSFTFSSNKSLVFVERELLNFMSEVQLEFCLRAGVLTKRYSSTVADQDAQFSFVHETVQEFLAAYHIANSNEDFIEHFQTDTKYNVLEMSETIIYLCGLECKKAKTLINRLADDKFLNDINIGLSCYVRGILGQEEILAFQTDTYTQRNIFKTENNSMDYEKRCLELSVLFQRMIIAGYIEAKASGEKEIDLNCRDFTFNTYLNESESNALKRLLLSNKSDVRSLILEMNVLRTSEILTVIQHSKPSLTRVKMTVTSEINKALYHTSIQEMNYIGNIHVSSFSSVFPSLSQLTFLEIVDSTFSEDIVLPDTIQHICLLKCSCTAVFLRRLLVYLSSFKHDVRFDLNTVNVMEYNTDIFKSEFLSSDLKNIQLGLTNGNIDLYHLIRCSSIGSLYILDIETVDSAYLSMVILPTLNKLKILYLRGTYAGRFDLKLPASLKGILLRDWECSSEWLCSLLITLSSFDHHVNCGLWSVVLQSSGDTLGDELHTHVSDLRSEILSYEMSNIAIIMNNCTKDLYEILRDTSIGTLDLFTSDCAAFASHMFYTLNSLTKLILRVSYTGPFKVKPPASLQFISLRQCECSSDWLCSLLITLSSLDHPVECELLDFVLLSSGDTLGDESHKHVSDFRSEIMSHDMSNIEIMVKNASKELFEILRETNIGTLGLSTADCASLASGILHTLNKLTKLYLWGTYTVRCDLKLPASLQFIGLQKVEFSYDWLCCLLIALSSFDHPVECELWDVVLQSNGDTLRDESHTHVSDLRSEILSHDMSNIKLMVKNGSKELFEKIRDTSIGILGLRTADSTSLASEFLHTLNKLTKLYLWGTYTGQCDLTLPASLQCIILQECECSSEWLCSLLITLSSYAHPVKCVLWSVVLQSSGDTLGNDSHTHVSDLRSETLSHEMSHIEIKVKNGSKELFEILRETSIGILDLRTAYCAAFASQMLHTLNSLTKLVLQGTYTGPFKVKLPVLLQCISLQECEISSDWLCSLLITLSSLDHPVECQLLDIVFQSSEEASCGVVRRHNPQQKNVWRSGRSKTYYNIHRRNWHDCVARTQRRRRRSEEIIYRREESHSHVSDLRSEMLSQDMSNILIMVKNGRKELFEILRDTSIGILDLYTSDCALLASEILQTLNRLTKLCLWGTYSGRCDIKLPTSLQCISLQECECSSEWLCCLLITLSSFDHHVECELWNIKLQSSGGTFEDKSHTHVSDLRSEILSQDMSNIDINVKNCSKELFEILRDTSIGILGLRTADIASLASEVLLTLNKLTRINLWGIYQGRCDLELPASLQCIGLQRVEFSYEWFCSLLITLSSLEHHVECELWNIELQSSGGTFEDKSHTHVSDLRSEILSHDMSNIDIMVNNGSKELFDIICDTSIGTLNLHTADCASLASEILHTLNKLTKLYLWGTYTGRCDLKLPASLQCISLQECECSSKWLCSLLITLSSFDHPVKCVLWDVVLQSSGENLEDELHTHISDLRSEMLSQDMSNIDITVNNCSKKLFEIFLDTSIRSLILKTANSTSLASEILHTLKKLTKLCLQGTFTGQCDLNMPASLQFISLQECECSSEWLCSLLIRLSSLDNPVNFQLYDVVLKSSDETRGDKSHTHVSYLQSKILSHDMSNIEIIALNGSKELFELLRDTSIGSLKVIISDPCLFDTVMRTKLNMLKHIQIEGTYLTRFDNDFPQSVELLCLNKGKCSLEWLYSALILLSKVKHHVLLDVKGLLISSNETCPPSSEAHVTQSEYSNIVRADLKDNSNTIVTELRSEILSCDMSNIELRVLNFHKERFEMLRDTSIKSVQLTAFDDVSLEFVTQNTLSSFKQIRLHGTYLTDFNHNLPPTIQLIILQEGSCSSDWLYSLLVTLSKLGHPVRVFLNEYVVLQTRESSDNSQRPVRGANLFNVKFEVFKDCPGLYETLPTIYITSLNMTQIEYADMLSQTLPLTHLQQLRICLKKYDMDMKLPEFIKYVFIIYTTFSPSSLIHFVRNVSTIKHSVQCKLLFRVEENEDEYTRIKQDYCESKSLHVQQFEVINQQGIVRGAAALSLSATADEDDDDDDKRLIRMEGDYVDSNPWIHYCKIRLNISCPDDS